MQQLTKSCSVEWYGLYKKFTVYGKMTRTLKGVYATLDEAVTAKNKILEKNTYLKDTDFMVETVQVKMKAWKI